ncbi:MAG: EAL domain-containing protein [Chromatiales bacterium]|nr:EAL domain-containing protein [Chromatiales bacterium]
MRLKLPFSHAHRLSPDELTSSALRSGEKKQLLDYIFFQGSATVGHEQAQALSRIAVVMVVTLILVGIKLFGGANDILEWHLISISIVFVLISYAHYRVVCAYQKQFLWRRYITIIADLGLTSYAVFKFGLPGLGLYPLYLWIIVGNGLRFGTHYLHFATIVGITGFLIACSLSGIFQAQLAIVYGLLVGLVMMPKFFLVMVHRLSEINRALQQKNEETEYAATHDPLTGLPNRFMFHDRLARALKQAKREGSQVAVIFIDLDSFKAVNDNFGHDQGDLLLTQIAHCLKQTVRANDLVARLGGDEFVILLENCGRSNQISAAVEQIFACSGRYYELDCCQTYLSWSCGAAVFPEDGTDSGTLLKNADTAMYRAKTEGTNQFRLYSADMTREVEQQLTLRTELRAAIDKGRFATYYQPLVDARTGQIVGAEALVRWLHPEQGLMLPAKFINLAEQSGLILPIGEQVLNSALSNLKLWRDEGFDNLQIHINISIRQLLSKDFLNLLQLSLKRAKLSAEALKIEVAESAFTEDRTTTGQLFDALKKLGIGISLDNFGARCSSLTHLKHYPISQVKIDKSLVQNIPDDPNDCTLVEATLAISQRLCRSTIAEGIETREQADWLVEKGCHIMQGFYFSPAMSANDFLATLRSGKLPGKSVEQPQ